MIDKREFYSICKRMKSFLLWLTSVPCLVVASSRCRASLARSRPSSRAAVLYDPWLEGYGSRRGLRRDRRRSRPSCATPRWLLGGSRCPSNAERSKRALLQSRSPQRRSRSLWRRHPVRLPSNVLRPPRREDLIPSAARLGGHPRRPDRQSCQRSACQDHRARSTGYRQPSSSSTELGASGQR